MGAQQSKPVGAIPAQGQVLAGKFRVEGVLGQGGMGIVLAAHHLYLDHRVALKLLSPELVRTPDALARFLNEARLAMRIKSEHVSRVMDMGRIEDGRPYIAMELLEGVDLGTLLARRGPLPVAEAVDYILQALDALAQAHAVGIVHRDLKPSNLFLADSAEGPPIMKILDFGISKVDDSFVAPDVKGITSSRAIVGSPTYMSPEQIRDSKRVDARADIWSTGVILYELLSGRVPFDGETPGDIFSNVLAQSVPPLRGYRPDVPEGLEQIILRCLKRSRDERFRDVGELAQALAPFGGQDRTQSLARIKAAVVKAQLIAAGLAEGTDPGRQPAAAYPVPKPGSVPPAGPSLPPDAQKTLRMDSAPRAVPPHPHGGATTRAARTTAILVAILSASLAVLLGLGLWVFLHRSDPDAPPPAPSAESSSSPADVPSSLPPGAAAAASAPAVASSESPATPSAVPSSRHRPPHGR